jgi:hypothetical protein
MTRHTSQFRRRDAPPRTPSGGGGYGSTIGEHVLTETTGQAVHPWRQQDLPLPKRQDRVPLPAEEEPPQDLMDDSVPTDAQEGHL